MKVFIARPRIVKELDNNVIVKLKNICKNEYFVLVGDAEGIDSEVQKNLNKNNYKNVKVFASNGIARNNYGDWEIKNVKVSKNLSGFEFYAQKDLEMAKEADIGFMIWNGKSKGTFNNIINLLKLGKEVVLYYVINKKFYKFSKMSEFEEYLRNNIKLDRNLRKMLPENRTKKFIQTCLF